MLLMIKGSIKKKDKCMNINIRNEKTEDYYIVENITRDAFWNLYCPGCNEHWIVCNLRKHVDFIPELSFVIELGGKVVGSIFYSHSRVIDNDKKEHKTITFGPVSILPHLHRKGLGSALITHSINKAKEYGYNAITIGGYPHHYTHYGFEGAKKFGISMPDGNYYTGIMALPLFDGALDQINGYVSFSEAMEPNENQLEVFDRKFPPKEKLITKSQQEFQIASSEIDNRCFI